MVPKAAPNETTHPPLPLQPKYWTRAGDRQRVVNDMFDRSARYYERVSEHHVVRHRSELPACGADARRPHAPE